MGAGGDWCERVCVQVCVQVWVQVWVGPCPPAEAAVCEPEEWGPQKRVQSVPRGRRSHVEVPLSRPKPLRGVDGGGPAGPSELSRTEALRSTVPWGCGGPAPVCPHRTLQAQEMEPVRVRLESPGREGGFTPERQGVHTWQSTF